MTQERKHDGCGIQDEITSLTGLTITGIHAGYWPAQKSIKFNMKSLIMKMLRFVSITDNEDAWLISIYTLCHTFHFPTFILLFKMSSPGWLWIHYPPASTSLSKFCQCVPPQPATFPFSKNNRLRGKTQP